MEIHVPPTGIHLCAKLTKTTTENTGLKTYKMQIINSVHEYKQKTNWCFVDER